MGLMTAHPIFTQSNGSTSNALFDFLARKPRSFTKYTRPNGAQQIIKAIDIINI